MIYTWNNLADLLASIAANHHFVSSFGKIALMDMALEKDTPLYPRLFMVPIDARSHYTTVSGAGILYQTFDLYMMDRLSEDRTNWSDVLSDTQQTLLDVIKVFRLQSTALDLDVQEDVRLTALPDHFQDVCGGWVARLTVKSTLDQQCDVPMDDMPVGSSVNWMHVGPLGLSGYSGYSGFSGADGASGFSGFSGLDGQNGQSGYSGYSGVGMSGYSGQDGASGFSGSQGSPGVSGFSGYSGGQGISGYSGQDGLSGFSGTDGASGFSGYYGLFGGDSHRFLFNATDNNIADDPGNGQILMDDPDPSLATQINISNFNADATLITVWNEALLYGRVRVFDVHDSSHFADYDVLSFDGNSGNFCTISVSYVVGNGGAFTNLEDIVFTWSAGVSGYSGTNGTNGVSGFSGYSGANGSSGFSGYLGVGTSGFSGYSGISGYSGANGSNGTSGFSGISGYSGTNGSNGVSGFSGISGYSGYSGSGVSGYSGISGYSGYSGMDGVPAPTTFDFTDLTGQSTSSVITSNTITLAGSTSTVWPFVTRGTPSPSFQVTDSDGVTSGWVKSALARVNDQIQMRQTSSASSSTMTTAYLYTENLTVDWNVTTAAFLPTSITGCRLWLDANQGITSSGGNVSQWNDQSAVANNFTAAGSARPTIVTNALNGYTVVRFNGSSNIITAGSSDSYKHFFIVAKYSATSFADYDGLICGNVADNNNGILIGDHTTAGLTKFYNSSNFGQTCDYYMAGTSYINSNRQAPMNFYALIEYNLQTGSSGWASIVLEMGTDRGQSIRYWNGDVAEVIAYNAIITGTNLTNIRTYISGKYGI